MHHHLQYASFPNKSRGIHTYLLRALLGRLFESRYSAWAKTGLLECGGVMIGINIKVVTHHLQIAAHISRIPSNEDQVLLFGHCSLDQWMHACTLTLWQTYGQEGELNGDDLRCDGLTRHAMDHVDDFPGSISFMWERNSMAIKTITTVNLRSRR